MHLCVQGQHIADELTHLREASSYEALEPPVGALEPFEARVLVA